MSNSKPHEKIQQNTTFSSNHPYAACCKEFSTPKIVFTLIDNGGTRIIKIPKQVTKLEAALLTSVFEKEISKNSPSKDEAEKALECLKATPIAPAELSDQDQTEALHNIFLFSVTIYGHVFSRNEFGNLQTVKAFRGVHVK